MQILSYFIRTLYCKLSLQNPGGKELHMPANKPTFQNSSIKTLSLCALCSQMSAFI